ncbi:hypothetical protein HYX58_05610 [Candidatus Dependentiae bacterium]|nr:hypothetical protein [Candidatus Dependentiae bacterium]
MSKSTCIAYTSEEQQTFAKKFLVIWSLAQNGEPASQQAVKILIACAVNKTYRLGHCRANQILETHGFLNGWDIKPKIRSILYDMINNGESSGEPSCEEKDRNLQ